MKRICVITGTRAEYGILQPLLSKLIDEPRFTMQLVVTGMHLSPEFGLTYKQIEADGFCITEKVEVLLSSDTSIGVCKSIGLGVIAFGEVYNRLNPDLIILVGDRYEILAAASAALICNIPIAHLHGGELTEGAFDESIRHAITKMSHLHFTSTAQYRRRVIQLGENPSTVFNVGALGIENIKTLTLLSKSELEEQIRFKITFPTALVTFHPETVGDVHPEMQFKCLLDALSAFENLRVIFTKSNSDTNGRIINQMIDDYVAKYPDKGVAFNSLGQLRYLSAIQHCDFVIGNSSSGIIEVPSFKKPTINIGDRQKGRVRANSVIDCDITCESIIQSIQKALSREFLMQIRNTDNPYEGKETAQQVIKYIKQAFENNSLSSKKQFYDL